MRTPTIFFPLALAELDAKIAARVLDAHFEREHEFGTRVPIPSVDLSDAAFFRGETPFLWRGPTWAGLQLVSLSRAAQARLRRSLRHAIEKSGFREYYDPITGEGHGAREFTWSGLLVDMPD